MITSNTLMCLIMITVLNSISILLDILTKIRNMYESLTLCCSTISDKKDKFDLWKDVSFSWCLLIDGRDSEGSAGGPIGREVKILDPSTEQIEWRFN